MAAGLILNLFSLASDKRCNGSNAVAAMSSIYHVNDGDYHVQENRV
ncbi:hypothetical protein O4H49_03205 [Kiloniella laminariae]|uniref:Uncharacterized protein n=1 Tax=Kiloniella laminariae TaxID=454162 RepID=A0ABT4LF92_9PROT|nr:hypothetical protein [Kiloniella laminariae]MCZ4279771.1 hypothetical protein [Kiloniella laminariae]